MQRFVQVAALAGLAAGFALTDPPITYALAKGWYNGRVAHHYVLGANTPMQLGTVAPADAPMYVVVHGFAANGAPDLVAGQNGIVGELPGERGYSDLRRLTFVLAPAGYVANRWTSVADVRAAAPNATLAGAPAVWLNLPIVPAGSTLEPADRAIPLSPLWKDGALAYAFNFGRSPQASAPLFVLSEQPIGANGTTRASGDVFSAIPGDPGYSSFGEVRNVVVGAGFAADSVRSAAAAATLIDQRRPNLLFNCPIQRVDGAATNGTTGTTAPSSKSGAPRSTLMSLLGAAAAVVGATLLAACLA